MNRKVVYNACYGGFSLSVKAIKRLYELKWPNQTLHFYKRDGYTYTKTDNPENVRESDLMILNKDFGESLKDNKQINDYSILDSVYSLPRHDPDLVRVVEELKEEASGYCSNLEVADIGESKYHIEEYDGYENVITQLAKDYWI